MVLPVSVPGVQGQFRVGSDRNPGPDGPKSGPNLPGPKTGQFGTDGPFVLSLPQNRLKTGHGNPARGPEALSSNLNSAELSHSAKVLPQSWTEVDPNGFVPVLRTPPRAVLAWFN
jgi:hypothetical protein